MLGLETRTHRSGPIFLEISCEGSSAIRNPALASEFPMLKSFVVSFKSLRKLVELACTMFPRSKSNARNLQVIVNIHSRLEGELAHSNMTIKIVRSA
jgi:hypothetical protein